MKMDTRVMILVFLIAIITGMVGSYIPLLGLVTKPAVLIGVVLLIIKIATKILGRG
jgi:hypothetical protein